MNVKFRKYLVVSSAVVIGSGVISVGAASYNKTLNATYNNIRVSYDGKMQDPDKEPFLVDGSVYVGLRDAGEMTNNKVEWDGANQIVHITSNSNSSSSANSEEIAKKNLEIASLKSEVADLEEEIEAYKAVIAEQEEKEEQEEQEKEEQEKEEEDALASITKDAIDDLIADLEDDYEDDYDVEWYFELKFDTKDELFEFDVVFDSDYDGDNFNDISNTQFNTFISDMCEDIQAEFGAFPVEGQITDDSKGDVLVSFTFNEDEELEITRDYPNSLIKTFEEHLQDEYSDLMDLSDPAFKDVSIDVSYVFLDPTSKDFDEVVFKVYTDLGTDEKTQELWNSLETSHHTRDLESELENLSDDIADFFDATEIDGYILNADDDIIVRYEDGRLRLENF